ncbi:MAG: hypothetical protein ACRDZO_13460 [Egibacteraceae bacterium]
MDGLGLSLLALVAVIGLTFIFVLLAGGLLIAFVIMESAPVVIGVLLAEAYLRRQEDTHNALLLEDSIQLSTWQPPQSISITDPSHDVPLAVVVVTQQGSVR